MVHRKKQACVCHNLDTKITTCTFLYEDHFINSKEASQPFCDLYMYLQILQEGKISHKENEH